MRIIHNRSMSFAAAVFMGVFVSMSQMRADEPAAPVGKKTVENQKNTVAAALDALKSHITGEATLEPATIEKYTKTIDANKQVIGSRGDIIKACFDLIKTYDEEKEPLWIGYEKLNSKKRTPGDEIHWAVFWVMQHVMDQVYTSEGMDRYGNLLDGFRFGSADYFPGKIKKQEITKENYTVKIDGSYPETWGSPFFHEDRPARNPTGAYLVPGTVATVTVPESMVDKGYQIRVGAQSWDLSKKPRVKRLYRCTTLYDIDSTAVKVANPLGGGIYIEVPLKADAGVVEVDIENAARSPYFSSKSFHKTSLKQWREVERKRQAPWADFQSENFMMQVPTSWIYKLDDPVTLMKNWDKALTVTNKLMGYPPQLGKETLYTQVDTQLRGRAFHPGYPAGNRGYDPTKDYGGYHTHHLVRGPQQAHSYELHELGHAYLFPKYAGDREAVVNLPHVAAMNRAFGMDLNEAFRSSRSQANEFCTLDTTAVAWMMSDHFVDDGFMKGYERQYQLKGHAKFVDIVRLFDWQVLDKFWRSLNQDYMDGNPWPRNVKDTDKYTLRLSKMAAADLRPLIHFWGIPTLDDAKSDAAIKAAGIRPSAKVYDLLVKYKGLVPDNNKAFREFALKWWQKEPSPEGYTTERNHVARWESYDEKEAARVRETVQAIIDRYFPNGRPDDEAAATVTRQ
ncbi:MAG: M60 family peptidase N-terminal accessory domain-containing protein [Lentisphaeria bacterium]